MNRKIACILLLTLAPPVFAAKLYRWHEADGSITFSPIPPAKGIPYDTIGDDTDGTSGLDKKALAVASPQSSNPVAELPAAPLLTGKTLKAPSNNTNKLSYAPATSSMEPGISRATVAKPAAAAVQIASTDLTPKNTTVISSKKRKQCEDLSKRVVSLERRLRLELSDADMDNTVLHMARYQASYDQYCDKQ
jgi:hypothetical protein